MNMEIKARALRIILIVLAFAILFVRQRARSLSGKPITPLA